MGTSGGVSLGGIEAEILKGQAYDRIVDASDAAARRVGLLGPGQSQACQAVRRPRDVLGAATRRQLLHFLTRGGSIPVVVVVLWSGLGLGSDRPPVQPVGKSGGRKLPTARLRQSIPECHGRNFRRRAALHSLGSCDVAASVMA